MKELRQELIAFNRIDGAGSSFDLEEFQQSFWRMGLPAELRPRTIGITIDAGTKITCERADDDLIVVESKDYDKIVSSVSGKTPFQRDFWLNKVIELFGLKGVKFTLENTRPDMMSSGLGGSSTATAGVALLANRIAGNLYSKPHLIQMASRIERGYGVSITGTQEQSNVMYGGVMDYEWYPYGMPHRFHGVYDISLKTELIEEHEYRDLESRMSIFHSGIYRDSSDVNDCFLAQLRTQSAFNVYKKMIKIAYRFSEALRLKKWDVVKEALYEYGFARYALCPGYTKGVEVAEEVAETFDGVVFPLGAGGGGAFLAYAPDPDNLIGFKDELADYYREIPVRILPKGHVFL